MISSFRYRRTVTLFLAGMVLLHALVAWNSWDLIRKGHPDFTALYAAGTMLRRGQGSQLYDPDLQFRTQREFAGKVETRYGALPFIHPPFEAVIFVPLAYLPYPVAFLLWDLLNLLLLAAIPRILQAHVPWLREISPGWWMLACLALFPVFIALVQGQDVLLLLGILALFFAAWKQGKDGLAGFWLALGTFRFHLVLPFLLVLLWKRRGRVLAGFLLTAGFLGLVSVAVVGWRPLLEYPAYVWQTERFMEAHGTISPRMMPNVRGLLDGLLLPGVSRPLKDGLIGLASLALVLFAAWRWKGRANGGNFNLGFALFVLTTPLVGYHTLPYDLCLLILPMVLVVNQCREAEETPASAPRRWDRIWLIGPMVVLFFSPLQMVFNFSFQRYHLMAFVLLLWFWGITRELAREEARA
ncbi:MAG: DUF2029 domain-containing protein [Acidobacteria bacterium]|nr:DUF2029 domain-containing protein [Acidobacteriota bacterium]